MAKQTVKESSAKSVIALFVSVLAFTIFILFYTNKDMIFDSGNLQSLIILIIIGMGFLVALLYLVNAPGSSKKRK